MLRVIALSLALLIGLGTIIPLATDYAEAGVRKQKKKKKKQVKYKKYSKKWWRAYHQRMNRKKALAKRKRAMRVKQILLARDNDLKQVTEVSENSKNKVSKSLTVVDSTPAVLPSGDEAPKGWKSGAVTGSELKFRVDDDNGSQVGSASISVVGPAMSAESSGGKNKTVGGVPTNSLRSTVIDRMIKENGWVVNDYQKEIGGKKVYVVVAQSEGAGGVLQSRMFYFTEVDGRIYSVATSSTTNATERIVQESEKVIDSLQRKKTTPQQASK